MNAERLLGVLKAIQDDLQKTDLVAGLQQLRDSLQKQVQQPQQPSHQQQVGAQLTALTESLATAPSGSFPPTWQELAIEIGAWDLLGTRLAKRITEIFQRNQITASVALEEIGNLYQEVSALSGAIDSAIKGLQFLKISPQDLEPGEAELAILIPRASVRSEITAFGTELRELGRLVGTFSEVACQDRPPLVIRAISSSGFEVFLALAPAVGACLASAVERVVTLYKQLLEIRRLRALLKEQAVPDESLESLDEHANSVMTKGIEPVVKDLLDKYYTGGKEGRRNELTIELRMTLNKVANRIDRGYNFEVRVKPLPEQSEGEDTAKTREDVATIQASAEGLKFIKLEGEPILSLPEATEPKEKKK